MKVALNSRLDEGKMYSQVQDEDLDESVNRKASSAMEDRLINKKSKFDQSNWFNRIFNIWTFGLVYKGFKRDLTFDDLYRCASADRSSALADQLESSWKQELTKEKPNFRRALVKTFWVDMIPIVLLSLLIEVFISNAIPVLLAYVIDFFVEKNPLSFEFTCWCGAGIIVLNFSYGILHHLSFYASTRLGIKVRVAWVTLLYRKVLRMKCTSMENTSVGQVLNLISKDVTRIDDFIPFFPSLFVPIIQTVAGFIICYFYIGPVCFIGLGIMIMMIPINAFFGKLEERLRTKLSVLTDTRIGIMNEIIKAMRVIKMYAWENHFSKLISEARKNEMNQYRSLAYLNMLALSISSVSSKFLIFATVVAFVKSGHTLNAFKIYVAMIIIRHSSWTLINLFPWTISMFYELVVSTKRAQAFLLLEEITNNQGRYVNSVAPSEKTIVVRNATIKWGNNSDKIALQNISLELNKGELLAVIGQVGSGKSTFLMSLMNETQIMDGSVQVNGTISYSSQEAWCFHTSILRNITFGEPCEPKKFERVIDVCAMQKDLDSLEHREKTLVGERGVSLSGGQKARINLARTINQDADIYLLDDPLSAVDSEVANHIFSKCIKKYLKSKAVILVTHQIQFLKKASKILVIEDGRQLFFGTYKQACNSGINLDSYLQKGEGDGKTEPLTEQETFSEKVEDYSKEVESIRRRSSSTKMDPTIAQESSQSGQVKAQVYFDYIKAASSYSLCFLIVFSIATAQIISNYIEIFVSNWTSQADMGAYVDVSRNIFIHGMLILGSFISEIMYSVSFRLMCIRSAYNLHNSIFYCLMRVPISFIDTNPTGRILNRFTKDLGIIDQVIPETTQELIIVFVLCLSILIVVSISLWYLAFPALIFIGLIVWLRAFFIRSARNIKRLESITRSPIYNHFTVTLSGLASVRAFCRQRLFHDQYCQFQDDNTSAYFISASASRFFGIVLDLTCLTFSTSVIIFIFLFYTDLSSGTVGLVIMLVIDLTGMAQWGVRQTAELESHMISVERIMEYSNLEPEAALTSNYVFDKDWPQTGSIKFDHVNLKYDNQSKLVLKDLCFEIKAGEKVSIVGRTGAGKSSVVAALFRMVEVEGRIMIDSVDCKAIGLHELRSKMSIIPQDSVAFIGTLRKNLDPFDESTDEQIWQVLEEVQLKKIVSRYPNQLMHQVTECGSNLSLGQRQLICLARALLKKNRILILDEATANIDHKTDELIQQTIRRNFSHCTILTIAHRLNTIIDTDRAIVMDEGQVVEFDTPYDLLQNKDGIFYQLVQQTGPQMAAKLTDIARRHKEKTTKNNFITK